MKLDQFAYLYSKPLGYHTLKIMKKIPGNLLKKPGKIMKISWNFVSPKKWEPWLWQQVMVFMLDVYISRTGQPLRVNWPSLINTLFDEFFVTKLSPDADNRLVLWLFLFVSCTETGCGPGSEHADGGFREASDGNSVRILLVPYLPDIVGPLLYGRFHICLLQWDLGLTFASTSITVGPLLMVAYISSCYSRTSLLPRKET